MPFSLTLQQKNEIARDTYEFVFDRPEGFAFTAGQHAELQVPNPTHDDTQGHVRSLTFASAPAETQLRFAFRDTDSGFKRSLLALEAGEVVQLEGPFGNFALHRDTSLPAVFIVGGIGVTAARSMVREAVRAGEARPLYVFYSNRTPDDAAYLQEFFETMAAHDQVMAVPTMTQPPEDWSGETGHIDDAMLRTYLPEVAGVVYYLVGPPTMVRDTRALLERLGVSDLAIKCEEFIGY